MHDYDLTANPFHLLKVSVRSTQDEIADAYEDALFDGSHDEALLLQAHQALAGPKTRLEAQMAWLPDCSPSQSRRLLELLEEDGDLTHILDEAESLEGLSAANMYAALCARSSGDKAVIQNLISSYDGLTEERTIADLDANRQVSGFPQTNRELVIGILPRIRKTHARAAVESIINAEHPGLLMTELVEDFLNERGEVRNFLEEIVTHYDTWSAPKLRDIKDQIDQSVVEIRTTPESTQPVTDIVQLLSEWDEYSQPSQLLEQEKGLDELRSKELNDELREICLWLANEQSQYQSALAISKALLDTFPELPTVAIQASDDIGALESLVEEAKSNELLSLLVAVVEKCVADLDTLDSNLLRNKFSPEGKGLAKALYQAFSEVIQKTRDTEYEDVPWMMVRGVAIELNNSGNAAEAALSILEGLSVFADAVPSPVVREQLDEDLSTIRCNLKFTTLQRAIKHSNLNAALQLANEIIGLTKDDDERSSTQQLKATIQERIRAKKRGRWFWAAAAAVVGFIWIANLDGGRSKRSYSPPTSTTYSNPSGTVSMSSSGALVEEIPPVGSGRTLSRKQIRYCVYQGERIALLRVRIDSDYVLQEFNKIVIDYNSRCSNYIYHEGVLQSVEKEVTGVGTRLENDVLMITLDWRAWEDITRDATPSTSTESRLLNPFSNNSAAIVIQQKLNELGYYKLNIDGIWGTGSTDALKEFKISNGLQPNDTWDMETQRRLFSDKTF